MNPGDLRHRIVIQRQESLQNGFGEPIQAWVDFVGVWAAVNPIVGKEYYAAEQVQSEVTHKIKMRYRPGITPAMRVMFKGRFFSILSVLNYQERNVELQLMCKELV